MTQIYADVQHAALAAKKVLPKNFSPSTGIILGTGLGDVVKDAEIIKIIKYNELENFPASTVDSHAGRFIFGRLSGAPVIIQQGRCHIYEGYEPWQTVMGVRLMAALGIKSLIVTNAAGALNPLWEAGDIMLIADHINMTGLSPLRGVNHPEFGPRFPDMSRPYDPHLASLALKAAADLKIRLEKGVYIGVNGPQMETPAETRFYRAAGADAVGMSTVLEVIAARHHGLRVLGLSCLTNKNLPDCMAEAPLEEVIRMAETAGLKMAALIKAVLGAEPR